MAATPMMVFDSSTPVTMRAVLPVFTLLSCLVAQVYAESPDSGTIARAEKGDPHAQAELGVMYLRGAGLAQDYDLAVKWFTEAAQQGVSKAQLYLGFLYTQGRGVPQDHAQAGQWFHLAAAQGESRAQFNLGNMYAGGVGVRQNLVEAYKWFELAATNGEAMAAVKRDMVAAALTPEQLAAVKQGAPGTTPSEDKP